MSSKDPLAEEQQGVCVFLCCLPNFYLFLHKLYTLSQIIGTLFICFGYFWYW